MTNWTFYPIFIATFISMGGLSRIAFKARQIDSSNQTLSELAATGEKLLAHFRNILILCGILFAITVFGYLLPKSNSHDLIILFGILMIGGELLSSVVPARNKYLGVHLILAFIMAVGMLGLATTFWLKQTGRLSVIEAVFTAALCIFAVLMATDKKRYIIYELGYIFTSHFSLLVATVMLK